MLITREEAAGHLGISAQAVSNLGRRPGCPKDVRDGRTLFRWPDFNLWYWTTVKLPTPDLLAARTRRETAEAEKAELELATMRKELLTVEDFRRVRYDTDQRVAARLRMLPTRAAPLLVGCQSEAEALERLAPVVRQVMAELHRGDDIPDAEAAA